MRVRFGVNAQAVKEVVKNNRSIREVGSSLGITHDLKGSLQVVLLDVTTRP